MSRFYAYRTQKATSFTFLIKGIMLRRYFHLFISRALTALSTHKPQWEYFFPFMELSPTEVTELSEMPHYLAGFRDASVEGRLELYDVFVNLAAIEITVAPHSKGM